ncbi:unnamed protein product [Schistocephalus solidus]|uniref:Reverse transcriptase domain-containing protein n=1 Tax=Schistocephalus solidus TaxID=70667 RepID=A0A183SVB0_SCHSO|nr:unnamed protein product [Schistocephalus solidus]
MLMLLPLTGTQLSPVAPRSWVLPSGHTPGNRHDRRAKPAISDAAIDRLPQVDTNNDLDLPLSLPESICAVQQISSGKSPGSDAIPLEVYKRGGPRLMAELITLFQEMCG